MPHRRLSDAPSPTRRLDGLEQSQGAALWLKDDGVFGTIYGGNKVRKLEWLLPDIEVRGSRSLFTWGGLATHWGLAAALYAQEIGVESVISLVDQPVDDHVRAHLKKLRDHARLHRHRSSITAALAAPLEIATSSIRQRGLPYILPPGGSSPLGALGYVEAGLELAHQVEVGELPEPSHIVVAVGSGGTAAGLLTGLRLAGLSSRIVGVVVAHQLKRERAVVQGLAARALNLIRKRGAAIPDDPALTRNGLELTRAWLGPGYGRSTEESERALALARENAGLELDPVYTAKAMAALLALDARGYFGKGPVLFLNTYNSLR
ncbi:MAG TPA: pyridoxal-phosphate dependent enzyme [Actinomycetota bacterium]|nr:pyridoxal-phosphate dependent enzyme [Actinomycetota bacterium]